MSEDKKLRKLWHGEITCAHCGKANTIKLDKEIIEPAEPAVTEVRVTVEKVVQAVLT